jgi:hypothetical protein
MKVSKIKSRVDDELSLRAGVNYLRGGVDNDSCEAACKYEYARESGVLIELARLTQSEPSNWAQHSLTVQRQFRCGPWFLNYPWNLIWPCPSFPRKSWPALNNRERRIIATGLGSSGTGAPLLTNEVWLLEATGVFEKFKAMAAEALTKTPKGKAYAVVEGWPYNQDKAPWVHALFTLDFRKGETQLQKEFVAWLRQKENRRRFQRYKIDRTGTTGFYKDRLSDIEHWRVYDAFAFISRGWQAKYANGSDQKDRDRVNLACNFLGKAKYGRSRYLFSRARNRAVYFLSDLIPWEFGKLAPHSNGEAGKRYLDALSKSDS